jgi:beta-lactamase superfamily II metal-dependent hydrolase
LNESESSCKAEARLTQIAPCQRGGRRQQRKSSTQDPSKGDSKKVQNEKSCFLHLEYRSTKGPGSYP